MPVDAAQSLLVGRKERLAPFLIGSLVGHLTLVVVVSVMSWVQGPPSIDLNQKPIRATLVRKGKPRDERLLPRKEELPPPPVKSEAAAKPTPASVPDKAVAVPIPGLKPAEKPGQKQDGLKDGDRRKALFGAFNKAGKASKEEELPGQEDGDPMGDSAVAEGERYLGLINQQIRRHYDVSNTIPEAERIRLRAHVLVTIDRTGQVMSVKLLKPSGNELYDAAVLAAIKKASPLSPPPDHLRSALIKGLPITFTP